MLGLIIILFVSSTYAQQFRTDGISNSCDEVANKLKYLQHIPNIHELSGDWLTLSEASFGSTDLIDSSEFVVNTTSEKYDISLKSVPDCIKHQMLLNVTHSSIFSKYFFEIKGRDTTVNATYHSEGGKWTVITTTEPPALAVSFLVLAAKPKSHIILATCRDYDEGYSDHHEEEVNTVIHILGRHHYSLTHEQQLQVFVKNAQLLNKREFLAAQLSDTCYQTSAAINLQQQIVPIIVTTYMIYTLQLMF